MINETAKACENVDFDNGVSMVREELERVLLSAPGAIRSQTGHLAKSKGKLIRAASLLACAENNDGTIPRDAVRLASSVELLHLATLVHDDVIDNADMRRGLPTLQKKFGGRSAVLCGDYLFCLALRIASGVDRKQEYSGLELPDYMGRVCLGELRQSMNNRNFELSVYRYLSIISGKTAALFEAAFYAGAMLCDDAKAEARLYSRLGHYAGMIFQLTDDCIDYESSREAAKKPVLSDFEQGVITLPLIYTFKKKEEIKKKAKSKKLTKEETNAAVLDAGGLFYTRLVARRYYDKALGIINKLNAGGEKKARLTSILDKAFKGLS